MSSNADEALAFTAVKLKESGNKAFKEGSIEVAISFYTRGLQLNPDNEVIYSNRALAFIKLKQFNSAVLDATKAISLNKKYAKAFHRRAVALIGLGKVEESFEDYKQILELEPLNEPIRKEFEAIIEQAKNASKNEDLMVAIQTRKFQKVVKMLRNLSSDEINAQMLLGTWRGATLLHFACHCNNFKVVELLLQTHNIKPNVKDEDGDTPIMLAAMGHDDNAQALKEMLQDQRVDLDLKNKEGKVVEDLGNSNCQNPEICLIRKMITDEKERRRIRSNIKAEARKTNVTTSNMDKPNKSPEQETTKTEDPRQDKSFVCNAYDDESISSLKAKIKIKQQSVEDAEVKFRLEKEAFDKQIVEMKEKKQKEASKVAYLDEKIGFLEKALSARKTDKEYANEAILKIEKDMETLKSNLEENETSFSNKQQKLKDEIVFDMESLKTITEKIEKEGSSKVDDSKQKGELVLLEFLNESIAKLEKELECPVCKETSQIPIFQCSESHLICSICRPKLEQCPECRKHYPKQLKRHRYAEKDLIELNNLIKKKQTIENGAKSYQEKGNCDNSAIKQNKASDKVKTNNNKSTENSLNKVIRVADDQQVWLGNLPCGFQDHILKEIIGNVFSKHGKVVDVAIINPPFKPSFGFVSFDSPETVSIVLQQQFWIAGTRLVVRRKFTKYNY